MYIRHPTSVIRHPWRHPPARSRERPTPSTDGSAFRLSFSVFGFGFSYKVHFHLTFRISRCSVILCVNHFPAVYSCIHASRGGASCCGPSCLLTAPVTPVARAPVQSLLSGGRRDWDLGVPSRSPGLPWVVSTIRPNTGPCREGGLSSIDERVRGHVIEVTQALWKSSEWYPCHPHVYTNTV